MLTYSIYILDESSKTMANELVNSKMYNLHVPSKLYNYIFIIDNIIA